MKKSLKKREKFGLSEMTKHLRMKCSSCGHWNRVPVNEIVIEQNSPEPKQNKVLVDIV